LKKLTESCTPLNNNRPVLYRNQRMEKKAGSGYSISGAEMIARHSNRIRRMENILQNNYRK